MTAWLRQFAAPLPVAPAAHSEPHPAVYVFAIMMLS
jgi:hypothetical protein